MGSDTLELLTSVGRLPARPAIIHSIRIGPMSVTDVPAMIVDGPSLRIREQASQPLEAVDGVIGFDLIRAMDITIDDRTGQVIIRKPVRLDSMPRWSRNLVWFGVPIVSALSDEGVPIHLALDTGAEETFGTPSLVRKTGATWAPAERRYVRGFGGAAPERGLVIPSVRLFLGNVPVTLERVFLYEAQYPTIFALDGTLGADVGRGDVLRIDMTNGRLILGRVPRSRLVPAARRNYIT